MNDSNCEKLFNVTVRYLVRRVDECEGVVEK